MEGRLLFLATPPLPPSTSSPSPVDQSRYPSHLLLVNLPFPYRLALTHQAASPRRLRPRPCHFIRGSISSVSADAISSTLDGYIEEIVHDPPLSSSNSYHGASCLGWPLGGQSQPLAEPFEIIQKTGNQHGNESFKHRQSSKYHYAASRITPYMKDRLVWWPRLKSQASAPGPC